MSENSAVEVRFTLPFKPRLKSLSKRYRQIRKHIQPIIDELQAGNFVGDQIAGTNYVVFKVRAIINYPLSTLLHQVAELNSHQ